MLSIYRLPNKLKDEKIIKVIRRDYFILFKKTLFLLLLLILPLLFFNFIILTQTDFINGEVSYPIMILSFSAYYLFTWMFFFFSFIDYYLDVWIVTSERIIDIEQKGYFSRVISEHKLFRIQDVTSEVHGFFPTVLKFGNCHIQTAGARQRFFFREIPNPDKVRDMVIKLVERNKKKHGIVEKGEGSLKKGR